MNSLLSHLLMAAISGTLFFFVVWAACLALRRLPAVWRCWLWRAVSLKFLLSLGVAISIPTSLSVPRTRPNDAPVVTAGRAVLQMTLTPATQATPSTQSSSPLASAKPTVFQPATALFVVWLIGVILVLAQDIRAWSRVRKMLRGSQDAPASESQEILGLSSHLARLHVRMIPDLDCPAVVGLVRQTILLPTNYKDASPEALSSALAHEMAHLRHKDLAWTLLAELVKAIFWFDPVAWMACRELRFESEVAADQLALAWTDSDPKAYAEHLLEWLNPETGHPLPTRAVPGLLLSTHHILKRLGALRSDTGKRRSVVALGIVLSVPIVLGLAPVKLLAIGSKGAAESPWPEFRGGPENRGQGAGFGAKGVLKWKFQAGDGVDSSTAIGPDGTIYVGASSGKLYALDPAAGTQKWAFQTHASIQSSPAVGANGLVYVGSWDTMVYAIDSATGTSRWNKLTDDGVYGSPSIGADGTVYVGSEDTKLYALAGSTGADKWSYVTGNIICSTPAIGADGTVYFGSNDGNVTALSGSNGAKKWVFDAGSAVVSSPALGEDGTVYVGSWDSNLFAIDGERGTKKWVFHAGGSLKASPALGRDGTVYISSFDHCVYALDGRTGAKKWTFKAPGGFNSSPTVGGDGTVYVGCWDHNLYALNGQTGAKKWSFATRGSVGSSPTIGADGTIYIGSEDGYLYAVQ